MNGRKASEYIVERENNRIAEGLSNKVSQLKNIAIDMRDEARSHSSLLSSLSDEFQDSDSLLGRTGKRLKSVAFNSASQNRTLTCYIVLASILLFLLFYYGAGLLSSSPSSHNNT